MDDVVAIEADYHRSDVGDKEERFKQLPVNSTLSYLQEQLFFLTFRVSIKEQYHEDTGNYVVEDVHFHSSRKMAVPAIYARVAEPKEHNDRDVQAESQVDVLDDDDATEVSTHR